MTTIVINENTEEDMNVEPFERIPSLPYTKEERIASVRKSMEDIRAGRTVNMEEMRAKHLTL